MTDAELDTAILDAHAAGDGARLAKLYLEASQRKQATGDDEAQAFLMVQAYVFALESGSALAESLHVVLKKLGREA